MEPVVIKVVQQGEGTALKDAKKDHDDLKRSLATPPPNLNAPQAPSAKDQAAAKRETNRRNRELVTDAETDLAGAQARGAGSKEVEELQNQVRERKLVARFQREQNIGEDAAIEKARNLVGLQSQAKEKKAAAAAEAKQHAVDEAAAAKAAASQKKAAEQAAAAEAKQRVNEESAATKAAAQQQREQEAVAKGRQSRLMQAMSTGGRMVEGAVGAPSIMPMTGGPVMMAAGIATAVAIGVAGAIAAHARELQLIAIEDTGGRRMDERKQGRMAGFEGSSGGSRSAAEDEKTELLRLQNEHDELEHKARPTWNPMTWMAALTGKNREPLTRNENEQSRVADRYNEDRKTQKQKFNEEILPQIEASEKIANYDRAGARAIQDKLTYHMEVKRLLSEGATNQDALRGADAKLTMTLRERAGQFGNLVNARSGAGDVARLASMAGSQMNAERAAVALQRTAELQRINMNANHAEAVGAATTRNFVRE